MKREFSELSGKILGCAIEVHKALGPGLLESAYQKCLAHEFHLNGIPFVSEYPLPVEYKGVRLDCGYRLDFLVNHEVILELKSAEAIHPIYEAQLLTYMKLLGIKQGFLINFNVRLLKEGIKSYVL